LVDFFSLDLIIVVLEVVTGQVRYAKREGVKV